MMEYQDWIAEWFANSGMTELTPVMAAAIIRKWRPGIKEETPSWFYDLAKVFDDMPNRKMLVGEVIAAINEF